MIFNVFLLDFCSFLTAKKGAVFVLKLQQKSICFWCEFRSEKINPYLPCCRQVADRGGNVPSQLSATPSIYM